MLINIIPNVSNYDQYYIYNNINLILLTVQPATKYRATKSYAKFHNIIGRPGLYHMIQSSIIVAE